MSTKETTDKKTTSANDKGSTATPSSKPNPANNVLTAKSEPMKKVASAKNTAKKAISQKASPAAKTTSGRKLAMSAVIIACLSMVASTAHYLWQTQHNSLTAEQNNNRLELSQSQLKQALLDEIKQKLTQQQQNFSTQIARVALKAKQAEQEKTNQLSKQVEQLRQRITQRQPSDWLLHEAEYLVRVAARTMWLEKDTAAAIGLLKDADSRLGELNNPKFLPIRALIHQDIKHLASMPVLEKEQAVLSLMALNNEAYTLPLASVESLTTQTKLELTDDINDWQENLKKTWQRFLEDFITVRRRSGVIEPLMAPNQQQNLQQNLSLKIQLAIWAASEGHSKIYLQALVDIEQWLREFYNTESIESQKFLKAIAQLKNNLIQYNYPADLASLSAMNSLLNENTTDNSSKPILVEEANSEKSTTDKPSKTEPENQEVL